MNNSAHDVVIEILNTHQSDRGPAPGLVNAESSDAYVGYFQSFTGMQWTVQFFDNGGRGILRCGSAGWDNGLEIVNGVVPPLPSILSDVRMWLAACYLAATCDPDKELTFLEIECEYEDDHGS